LCLTGSNFPFSVLFSPPASCMFSSFLLLVKELTAPFLFPSLWLSSTGYGPCKLYHRYLFFNVSLCGRSPCVSPRPLSRNCFPDLVFAIFLPVLSNPILLLCALQFALFPFTQGSLTAPPAACWFFLLSPAPPTPLWNDDTKSV